MDYTQFSTQLREAEQQQKAIESIEKFFEEYEKKKDSYNVYNMIVLWQNCYHAYDHKDFGQYMMNKEDVLFMLTNQKKRLEKRFEKISQAIIKAVDEARKLADKIDM